MKRILFTMPNNDEKRPDHKLPRAGGNYEVGNRKPPKHSRFQPGESGNPSGRPRGSLGFKTLLAAELATRIKVSEGGKTKMISKQAALAKQVVAKVLKGDDKAFGRLVPLMLAVGAEELTHSGQALTTEQRTILERNARRLLDVLAQRGDEQ